MTPSTAETWLCRADRGNLAPYSRQCRSCPHAAATRRLDLDPATTERGVERARRKYRSLMAGYRPGWVPRCVAVVLGDCLWFVFIFSLLQNPVERGAVMGASATTPKRPPTRPPVMGLRARVACRVEVEGEKRRRLLVLLAAVADGNDGVCRPSPALLLERVPAIRDKAKLFAILKRLADDGLIRPLPRGGGYELLFVDGDVGGGV